MLLAVADTVLMENDVLAYTYVVSALGVGFSYVVFLVFVVFQNGIDYSIKSAKGG